MTNTKEFFLMLPVSIGLWLVFEAHNLVSRNWEYIGLPQNKIITCLGFGLSFATILPAIYETSEFLKSRNLFAFKIHPRSYGKTRLVLEILLGFVLIDIATFFPSTHTGALIWPGYMFVFAPLNYLLGIPSIFDEREEGRLSGIANLLVAGYICGLVWEFLNFWASAKWVYHGPYFPKIKIFEMPVVGFLGFGPFAIAFLAMYHFIRYLPGLLRGRKSADR